MKTIFKIMTPMLAAALVACGGGGGSPGTTQESYSITLRADKNQLPLNIQSVGAGQGAYSPFTTSLYVEAKKGGLPVSGGEDIFGCNISGGLDSGSLYYLDGDDKHEEEVDDGNGGKIKVPLAYRSITLGANSGGNSFHFHAKNQAGTARITCSVTDPRDSRVYSASVDITVGGATGRAASIKGIAAYPLLGTQGNLNNLRTSTAIEAYVLDDANQPVPASAKANLQVAIVSGGAANGARLLAGSQSSSESSSVVRVSTTGGVGLFSLTSGSGEGSILLEMKADRFDNDVTNGIQDPITQLLSMAVTTGTAPEAPAAPLVLVDAKPPAGVNGLPYSYAFSATGGVAPYTWTALGGGLPEGFSLDSSGILSGTPAVKLPGVVNIAVRVTDSKGISITGNFPLEIAATAPSDPSTNALSINLSGCAADVNTSCLLTVTNPMDPVTPPAVNPKYHYQYVLTVTGPGTGNAVWTMQQEPSWLSLTGNGILTILYVNPPVIKDCKSEPFFITAVRGGSTTTRKVQLTVGSGVGTCHP